MPTYGLHLIEYASGKGTAKAVTLLALHGVSGGAIMVSHQGIMVDRILQLVIKLHSTIGLQCPAWMYVQHMNFQENIDQFMHYIKAEYFLGSSIVHSGKVHTSTHDLLALTEIW